MRSGGLGFVPLSPSPDPASLTFDAIMAGAEILGPLIKSLIGTAHLDANKIVVVQNELHHEVLEPTVAAKDNPNTSVEDLIFWRDTLIKEGEAFYQFTLQFPSAAGSQARETIFGIQDAAGNWITTSSALGIATQILNDLGRIIGERTGDVNKSLGFDWSKLAQIGVQVAAGLTGKPVSVGANGQIVVGLPPSQQPTYYTPPGTMPSWAVPAGIGLVVLLLVMPKSRG